MVLGRSGFLCSNYKLISLLATGFRSLLRLLVLIVNFTLFRLLSRLPL